MNRLPNIHPGEVLREEFLIPLQISQYRPAKEIGVANARISAICAGKRSVTADTALRLAAFFGATPGFWLGLQVSNGWAQSWFDQARATLATRFVVNVMCWCRILLCSSRHLSLWMPWRCPGELDIAPTLYDRSIPINANSPLDNPPSSKDCCPL